MIGLAPLVPWYRVVAIGHGHPEPRSAEDASEIARAANPVPVTHLAPDGDPGGLRAGIEVRVTPDDNARVPVTGTLVAAGAFEVVIHRMDPQAGDLHIPIPRLGFDVMPVVTAPPNRPKRATSNGLKAHLP